MYNALHQIVNLSREPMHRIELGENKDAKADVRQNTLKNTVNVIQETFPMSSL